MPLLIRSLYSYPVKSCAGMAHDQVRVRESGLEHDRQWVIVDAQGVFMTQRQFPRMVLIRPSVDDRGLTLNAPSMGGLFVPHSTDAGPAIPVAIFGSPTLGADEGDEAALWLSTFLDTPCRLLRQHPQAHRPASLKHVQAWHARHPQWPQAIPGPGRHAFGFADGFPFLVTNQGSLAELNQHLADKGESAVEMIRFRPNIVLDGLEPYDEDYLAGFRAGDCAFAFVKACARCPIPNVDPASGLTAPEPGITLAAHRQFEQGVLFGLNAVVGMPGASAQLRVGDSFEPDYDF